MEKIFIILSEAGIDTALIETWVGIKCYTYASACLTIPVVKA